MLFDSDQRPGYRRKKTNWVNPRTLGVVLLFIALIFMLVYAVRDENEYSTPFERVIYAPVSAFYKVRTVTVGFFSDIGENFRAKRELDRLQKKLDTLQRENGRLMYQLRRFEAYREALDLPTDPDLLTLPAIVITQEDRLTQAFIINRGTTDGVKANMAVWDGKGLVGRTLPSLTDHRAKVQPITDPRSAIGVYVHGTEFEGILRGTEEGIHLILTDLHRVGIQNNMQKPEPGRAVFSSGAGLVFPRNLLAGHISEATSEEGIVVEPAVNLERLNSVSVILNSKLREETLQLLAEDS